MVAALTVVSIQSIYANWGQPSMGPAAAHIAGCADVLKSPKATAIRSELRSTSQVCITRGGYWTPKNCAFCTGHQISYRSCRIALSAPLTCMVAVILEDIQRLPARTTAWYADRCKRSCSSSSHAATNADFQVHCRSSDPFTRICHLILVPGGARLRARLRQGVTWSRSEPDCKLSVRSVPR